VLDGMRDPLPDLEDVELYHDVVVSGYSADMTEDDLWKVFGNQEVAAIMQLYTPNLK
jgi:hypothetical protein